MIFLLIVNVRISKMLGKIEHLNLQAADTRVGILTEIVSLRPMTSSEVRV